MNEFKKLTFGQDSRKAVGAGVEKLARAVKATLGPRGRNVVIQHKMKAPHITKDGVTVAKSIELRDPGENIGAQMVKQVASKTADVAGDGTTTATVLAESIFSEGMKLVGAGHDPMNLKRGVDKAVDFVVEELKKLSREVTTSDDIRKVATISANGDTAVGDMIAEAMDKVGNNGVISLEEGKGFSSSLRVSEGFEFDRGYVSAYFMTPEEAEAGRNRCVFDNARVWLVKGKLSTGNQMQEMLYTLDQCVKTNTPVVIIAESIEDVVLNTLAVNAARGTLQCVAIKSPGFGASRDEMLEDLAVLTGATLRDPGHFESVTAEVALEELGFCRRIEVYRDRTVIVAGDGREEEIRKQCDKIRGNIDQADSIWDREQLEKRLAKLTGGVAVIEVGAPTEVAMKELRDRIEDALSATRAAVTEGIVPGGGVALVRCLKSLEGFTTGNVEEDFGVAIIKRAVREPLRAIAANAGSAPNAASPDLVLEKVFMAEGSAGYDASSLEFVGDMFERGVVDPTKVTRVALQNAADVAGLLLTTECVVTIEEDEVEQQANPMMVR